jgi:hypothetical protein
MTADKAMTSPASAAESSARDTGSSGIRDVRKNSSKLRLPRTVFDSPTAVCNEKPSRTMATPSTAAAHQMDSGSRG